MKGLKLQYGSKSQVVRNKEYESIWKLYDDESTRSDTLQKYPFRVLFVGEKGVDIGGVCRDAFSAFYDTAFEKYFDGSSLLTPAIHPGTDMAALKTLGCIVSHAYLVCGILPVKLAFPCLAQVLLPQRDITIPDEVYLLTFLNSLSIHDQEVLRMAYAEIQEKRGSFSESLMCGLQGVLSLYGCRQLPRPDNLRSLTLQLAKFQFALQPSAAICAMRNGIAPQHLPFWKKMTLGKLYQIYCALSVSPAKVIKMLEDVSVETKAQEKVLGYFRQYIGNITNEQLCILLRFVTGCGVCTGPLAVTFNRLDGFKRRPVSHTCSNTLELPSTYTSYIELKREFDCILNDIDNMWKMDSY